MTSKDTIIIPTSYLPALNYFSEIVTAQHIFIEASENYVKQSLRNRCYIYAANGVLCLSVPVQKKNTPFQATKDIRIDYSTPWQANHWHSIVSAYNASPFFIYFRDDLAPFYEKKINFLLDFNTQILDMLVNKALGLKNKIQFTDNYIKDYTAEKDLRYICAAKRKCKPENSFVADSVTPYFQLFAHKFGFKANLSIIDLLFNEGPYKTLSYLTSMCNRKV